ncbi:phosphoglucosamine mutase [sulfur-oxidizing endosymbiont of Gigantopelta aegis]|uniref:phosphoglucosamine mutase n=1 Tax=sulfur-oxidizing endosymbiont of Gigantopelta aegis TaxID=2794934 RepID=UPI0018DECED3|nr:phosphoglucosamine mutase [sulfur-oxidizing endosymbiont of Gigantopelta aegis]
MKKKFFGTDGIRGKVGEYPMTAEFVMKLGWAAGRVLAKQGKGKAVIGKDTRISGYMYESALEAGLSAAGIDCLLTGPMPTPGIAYLTRTMNAQLGIVISASHNPYYDNGIKFFSADGTKLSDEIEHAIEAEIENEMQTVESAQLGKARRIRDAAGRYIEYCKGTTSYSMELNDLRIVVDTAHGAAYHIAPSVFGELGAEVIAIGNEPDGVNINEKVGSTYPEALQQSVLQHRADLGIALDGDADRLMMVDHLGEIIDGDELLFIMAIAKKKELGHSDFGVVGTLMSNLGMEVALKREGLGFICADVGDRYVMEALKEHNWTLGGESSGHLICLDQSTTGDGIVAALKVLASIADSNKTLHELKKGMDKYPQKLINVRIKEKLDPFSSAEVTKAVSEAEARLADKGRVLLRASGTEPLIRVMIEGSDAQQVMSEANALAKVVEMAFA